MHHLYVTVPAAVLPSLLLIWYFYRRDVFPEPRGMLLATFGLGVLAVIPVLCVALPLMYLVVTPLAAVHPLLGGVAAGFLTAGVPEEFFKFVVVAGYCARRPEFDEPMDGIVYGAVASLGFATMENVLYVESNGGMSVALSRAFTAVPCHAFLGAIMGYFIGQAKFRPERRGTLLTTGLVVAMLLHSLYDMPLLVLKAAGADVVNAHAFVALALVALPFGLLLGMGIVTIVLVQRLRRDQLRLLEAVGEALPPAP
ncbi:MAG TPA: PrsW family glutamic-type intramembrane protease [Gemmataceae bacterium]|nr:PrsW family glutamic-type intramembrane protease [Gemmataceae bacterium]